MRKSGVLTKALAIGVCALAPALLADSTALAAYKPPTTWNPAHSGNYTKSTTARGIYYIVIHTIEGTAAGAISWFKNPASKVSAHYIVDYSGAITQMLTDGDKGWHAGNSYYNTHSIGIEHAGYAYKNYWTEAEYAASATLTRYLCLTYGIPMDRKHIIGHVEVPGATHTDPGPYFNWDKYMKMVKEGVGATAPGGGTVSPPPPSSGSSTSARKVTASSLNVRSGPGTSYSIKGQAASGQVYIKTSTSGEWQKIWWNGGSAWFHSGYTTGATGSAAKVTADTLNVRTGPSTGYKVVGSVHSGQLYFITSTSAGWYKVYWGGGAYWIYSGYASKVGM